MSAAKKATKESKAIKGIPTIEVSLNTLYESFDALKALSMTPVRAFISFRISRILKQVREEIKTAQDTRKDLLDRLGHLPEGEMAWKFDAPEKKQEFDDEMKKLLDEKVEINGNPLKISELKTADGSEINIEPAALELLDWLVKED